MGRKQMITWELRGLVEISPHLKHIFVLFEVQEHHCYLDDNPKYSIVVIKNLYKTDSFM